MDTGTLTLLTPTREGFNHLLVALQRTRSIAAEGGYLDILQDRDISLGGGSSVRVRGLDNLAAHPKTLDLMADLAAGDRQCDASLWANISRMVATSPSWQISLAMRGKEMPEFLQAMKQFQDMEKALDDADFADGV